MKFSLFVSVVGFLAIALNSVSAQINNAVQHSEAISGDGGVSIASGVAIAGGRGWFYSLLVIHVFYLKF